jgi:A/G-specific adenine glycosylase
VRKLAELILEWYALHARKLPWRDHPDPYSVWVSEIMLQQTRVDTVIPYFEKWMKLFPGISELAKASEDEVLKAWEGLGYYGRARNLHRSARSLVEFHDGVLPGKLDELIGLPGIGRYTAAAIASIAFHEDEPTLDGNIKRIFARVFDIQKPVNHPDSEKKLWSLVEAELPTGRAGDYNQALMDLGASICLPQNPKCQLCPIISLCQAMAKGVQSERPILKAKSSPPHYTYVAAILKNEAKYLLIKRPSQGLLGGMWEFPNDRVGSGEIDLEEALVILMKERFGLVVKVISKQGVYKRAYTHFRLDLHAFNCQLEEEICENSAFIWVSDVNLVDHPMGKVARLIAKGLYIDGK